MSEEKFKFNGSNYKAFKVKLLDYLLLQDLDSVVINGIPEETASNYAVELKKDKKAQAHIRLKLSDKTLDYINEAKTSKEILSKLDSIYARTNIVSLALKEEEFNSRKLKSNEKLQDYLNDLSRLKSEINEIQNDTVKPYKHAIRILNGLSSNDSYKNVVSSLYTMATGKANDVGLVNDITTRLLDECKLFDLDKDTGKETRGSALKTDYKKKNNSKKKEFKCWSCGDKDPKHECKKSFCSLCGKQGHRAYKCQEREKDNENGRKSVVSMMASGELDKHVFYLDSGSSHHITIDKSILFDYSELKEPIRLGTSKQGSFLTLIGKGKVKYTKGETKIEIKDVYFSNNANANLFSNSIFDANGARTVIQNGTVRIETSNGIDFLTGKISGSLYALDIRFTKNEGTVYMTNMPEKIDLVEAAGMCAMTTQELHMNLGHANFRRVEEVSRKMDLKIGKSDPCIDCVKAKITRASFNQKLVRATRPLELVHSDVGFINIDSFEGHNCFSIFVDDYSNYCIGYIMSSKGQVQDCFIKYATMTQAKYGSKIATLRIDDGKEYKSKVFLAFCQGNGTHIQTSDGYTPELNGKSERFMRSIVEMIRVNLISSKLPKELWDECFFYSIYTLNVLPSAAINGSSPYLLWTKKDPNYLKLHPFGALAIKHIPKELRKKLDDKGELCIFVGYDKSGFRLFMPTTNRISVSRHVRILNNVVAVEKLGLEITEATVSVDTLVEDDAQSTDVNWDIPFTISDNIMNPSDYYLSPSESETSVQTSTTAESNAGIVDQNSPPPSRIPRYNLRNRGVLFTSSQIAIPQTYIEAREGPFAAEWKMAMEDELASLKNMGVYDLVKREKNMNVVKAKWVYAVKTDVFGNVLKFKARLTGKGYSQKHGIDFEETYAPVAEHSLVRLILAVSLELNLYSRIIDISTAFLNSNLKFDVYMMQPEGYEEGSDYIFKLKKSLYGLKQGAHDWYETFDAGLKEIGFERIRSDYCVYVFKKKNDSNFLILWVDDMIISSSCPDLLKEVIQLIFNKYNGKDLGDLSDNQFFNWNIKRNDVSIYINQQRSIVEALTKFGMINCKKVKTPSDPNVILGLEGGNSVDNTEYRSIIGSLFHIANCSRPDLSFAVSYVSRFQTKPTNLELTAAKRVLQYLNATKDEGLYYEKSDLNEFTIKVYVDASFAPNGGKSTSGWIVFLNKNPISWKTLKQTITAKSSAEAEYVALSQAISDALFIRSVLIEMGLDISKPIEVFEDNQAAIQMANNPVFKSKIKQVNVHYHFIRDYVKLGIVNIVHVQSGDQIADMFTKSLNGPLFRHFKDKINVRNSVSGGSVEQVNCVDEFASVKRHSDIEQ